MALIVVWGVATRQTYVYRLLVSGELPWENICIVKSIVLFEQLDYFCRWTAFES